MVEFFVCLFIEADTSVGILSVIFNLGLKSVSMDC